MSWIRSNLSSIMLAAAMPVVLVVLGAAATFQPGGPPDCEGSECARTLLRSTNIFLRYDDFGEGRLVEAFVPTGNENGCLSSISGSNFGDLAGTTVSCDGTVGGDDELGFVLRIWLPEEGESGDFWFVTVAQGGTLEYGDPELP